jgi:hypothetical protein
MPRRTTLQHTLAAALAAGIVAATPALAAPTDRVDRYDSPTSSLAGTITPRQDLRGEHARDAARAAETQIMPEQPTWPTHPAPVVKAAKPAPAPATASGDDDIWLVLGIGLAATGIVAAGAAGAGRRYRVRARRVAA